MTERRTFLGAVIGILTFGMVGGIASPKPNDNQELVTNNFPANEIPQLDRSYKAVPADKEAIFPKTDEVLKTIQRKDEEWISLENVLQASDDIRLCVKRGKYGCPTLYDKTSGKKVSRVIRLELVADAGQGIKAKIEFIPEECDFSMADFKVVTAEIE